MFHLFQIYVAFECFMLQVQIVSVGVPWGRAGPSRSHRRVEEVQATTCGVRRRHGSRGTIMEEAGASHPGSMGSGSEVGGLDASAENKGGAGGARIWADETEQPRTSECYYASSVAGFSLAELLCEQISSRLGLICTRKGRGRPTSVPLRNNNWYNNNTKCMFFVDHT
jgi:hypothetical protein